jgi:RNA-binding protein YlmH
MNNKRENILLEAKVEDAINRVKKCNIRQFLNFLDPSQQEICKRVLDNEKDIQSIFFGGHEHCERKKLAIHPLNDYINTWEWPISVLHLYPNYNKKELKHSDILGRLLSLGIKRNRIGDINIIKKTIQIFISEELQNYITYNLDTISNTSINVEKVDWNKVISYTSPFISNYITVSSLRLDGIVSKQYGLSRKESVLMIKSGKVKVNWQFIYNPSVILKEKDVISVRGKGRAVIKEILGKTRKGNTKILIHKNK